MCRTTVLFCLVAVALSLSNAEETKSVAKRQTYYWYYYICGTYPYQWTSYYPCNYYNPQPQPQPQPTYWHDRSGYPLADGDGAAVAGAVAGHDRSGCRLADGDRAAVAGAVAGESLRALVVDTRP
uniref:Secreted protein n=1 Tax=Steinernema glaseri TaxID=37863 RepID=A0A1I7ZZB7_9BILA